MFSPAPFRGQCVTCSTQFTHHEIEDQNGRRWPTFQALAVELGMSRQRVHQVVGTGRPLRELELTFVPPPSTCPACSRAEDRQIQRQQEASFALLDGEEFRPVPGFSPLEVSNLGRVVTTSRGVRRLVSANSRGGNYPRVGFAGGTEYVHRLVALTWLPAPLPGQTQVLHLDETRTNNTSSNLRWGTGSENLQAARDHASWPCRTPVKATSRDGSHGFFFRSIAEAERALGLPEHAVQRVLRGFAAAPGGWTFEACA